MDILFNTTVIAYCCFFVFTMVLYGVIENGYFIVQ